MNILLYDMGSYTQKDLIAELKKAGHHCKNILYKSKDIYHDAFFERRFARYMEEGQFDLVMSMNYFPTVARISHAHNLKYISWVYDSPINTDNIEEYQYPNSYIFLFDRAEVERLLALGGQNIFHMPLAVVPHKFDRLTPTPAQREKYSAEISFVGQFYQNPLGNLMGMQDDYLKGYVDAVVQAQLQIYGCNFTEEVIDDAFMEKFNQNLAKYGVREKLTKRGFVQTVAKQVTHIERLVLLNLLGSYHEVKYYSSQKPASLSHLTYGGTAYYHTEMPLIFKLSKLNLNPTLKCIQTGIPLRCLDILSAGGLLFSNYQTELMEYFTDGEDVVVYESMEDALAKAQFYLEHEALREEIAQKGCEKTYALFSYPDKLKEMFQKAGL